MRKHYVLEVVEGCEITRYFCDDENAMETEARNLAKENGRAAVLSGAVTYFWAVINDEGKLEVGTFDDELLEEPSDA